jgi:hypothetical protein
MALFTKNNHDVPTRLLQNQEIPDPINISVDEKSFKKRHNYVTIIKDTDLKKSDLGKHRKSQRIFR